MLVVGTETSATCSFEYSLWVLPSLLALLTFHVLLELPIVVDAYRLLWLNAALLFEHIKIGKVVEKVNFCVLQSDLGFDLMR